jgi:hypothetical protein
MGAMEEGEESIRLCFVRSLIEVGEETAANHALLDAYHVVLRRAASLAVGNHRNAYRTRLRETRETLLLAAERLGMRPAPSVPPPAVDAT